MNIAPTLARIEALWARQKTRRSRSDTIAPDVALQVLSEYDLAVKEPPARLGYRGASKNLVVDSTLGKLLLKRYKPSLELPQIECAHSILIYLAAVDFPAPRLVPTHDGGTWVQSGGYTYALFHFLDGYIRYPNTFLLGALARPTVAAAGEMLACLHQQLQGFVPQGCHPDAFRSCTEPRGRGLIWFGERLAWCVEETRRADLAKEPSGTIALLVQRADGLYNRYCELEGTIEAAAPLRLTIHGDYGPHNLLYRPNTAPMIIDYEGARLDWRITDLARAMRLFSWHGASVNLNKMKWLLDAYEMRGPIAEDEVLLIPAVWQYCSIPGIINAWHDYVQTRANRWLENIRRHLRWMDWIANYEAETLAQLVSARGGR